MRLLVHGLQSSGASTVTALLAQRPDCVPVIDVMNTHLAPPLETARPCVVKTVVTTRYSLADHQAAFRPDATLMVLRDPRVNWLSLERQPWAALSGSMAEKFSRLEALHADLPGHGIDAVVHYEDIIDDHPAAARTLAALGWPVEPAWRGFPRDTDALFKALITGAPDTFTTHLGGFGMGNFRGGALQPQLKTRPVPAAISARVAALCPGVLARYASDAPSRVMRDAAVPIG